jgi:hypothetical protein
MITSKNCFFRRLACPVIALQIRQTKSEWKSLGASLISPYRIKRSFLNVYTNRSSVDMATNPVFNSGDFFLASLIYRASFNDKVTCDELKHFQHLSTPSTGLLLDSFGPCCGIVSLTWPPYFAWRTPWPFLLEMKSIKEQVRTHKWS